MKPTTPHIEAPPRLRARVSRTDPPSATDTLATRFEASTRREVRRLLRASPRVAEMASVCPAVVHVLAARVAPTGTIDVGPRLGLPPLPTSRVVLLSRVTAPEQQRALRILLAAFRTPSAR